MKCEEVQESLGEYWDLPEGDFGKRRLDEHIKHCAACAEEFRFWQESEELIKVSTAAIAQDRPRAKLSTSVMDRIYASEAWRVPVPNRSFHLSFRMRKIVTLMMSFFLALFVFSLFHALVTGPGPHTAASELTTIMPVAHSTVDHNAVADEDSVLQGVPVASISDPLVLRMSPVKADPNYWIALSLIGIVSILLIMNWLSRVRA